MKMLKLPFCSVYFALSQHMWPWQFASLQIPGKSNRRPRVRSFLVFPSAWIPQLGLFSDKTLINCFLLNLRNLWVQPVVKPVLQSISRREMKAKSWTLYFETWIPWNTKTCPYSATIIAYNLIAKFLEVPWDVKIKKDDWKWKPWFLILNTGI